MTNKTLVDIRQALGYDEDDSTHDNEIEALSADRQLELWCQWNGLLGSWHHIIRDVVFELYKETK